MINTQKIFVHDKQFYKNVFKLVLPLVAMQAMFLLLNFCDIMMVGRMDEEIAQTAISAANIANRPFVLFGMFIFGSMSGATVLCSQYWGKKDVDTINSIAGTTLAILLPVSLIFIAICFIFTEQIMFLISDDPAIVELAVKYLRIILVTFVFNAITSLFSGILRSVEKVIIPLAATSTGIILNIFLNAILIYGYLGFRRAELKGRRLRLLLRELLKWRLF